MTRVSRRDRAVIISPLLSAGIRVEVSDSDETTEFVNEYRGHGHEHRIQRIEAIATPFECTGPARTEAAVVFGPLTTKDIPVKMLDGVASTSMVALDIQGLLRKSITGPVTLSPNPDLEAFVRASNVVKAGREEALLATDQKSVSDAIAWFLAHGVDEIIITSGGEGSVAATREAVYQVPAFHFDDIIDTTGCGDVYLAVYIMNRLAGAAVPDAALAASAAAGLSATSSGAPQFDSAEVDVLIQSRSGTHTSLGR